MTTYLIIGLILLLGVYLVRSRRSGSADNTASPTGPTGHRFSLRPGKKPALRPSLSEVIAADDAGPETAATALADLPAARSGTPIAQPTMEWTPEDTIVEPGWPLPGEISGGWSTTSEPPDSTPVADEPAPPSTVLTWPSNDDAMAESPDADPIGDASPSEPSTGDEWTMPAADVPPSGDDAGPPLWVPGEVGPPVNSADDEDPADAAEAISWETTTPPETDAPSLSWGPTDTEVEAEAEAERSIWLDTPRSFAADDPASEATTDEAQPEHIAWADEPQDHVPSEPETDPAPADATIGGSADFETGVSWSEPFPDASFELAEASVDIAPIQDLSLPEQSAAIADIVPTLLDGLVPFTRVCDRLGVTPRMLALLRILADTPLSITEQSRRLGVPRAMAADISDRLEALGLIHKTRLEGDRRRVRLALTDPGYELYAESAVAPDEASVEAVLARLAPAERAHLLDGLRALADSSA